eukprot:scaffold158378_cov27-Tisochrysis_lutea.AAC.5
MATHSINRGRVYALLRGNRRPTAALATTQRRGVGVCRRQSDTVLHQARINCKCRLADIKKPIPPWAQLPIAIGKIAQILYLRLEGENAHDRGERGERGERGGGRGKGPNRTISRAEARRGFLVVVGGGPRGGLYWALRHGQKCSPALISSLKAPV